MRIIWTVVLGIGLCFSGAFDGVVAGRAAGSRLGELAPTPLEAFAARSSAKVVWSRTIGQIEGPAARATVTAVAVEDVSSAPAVMRGLRIDLTHLEPNPDCNLIYRDWTVLCARPGAAVYLDEDRLQSIRAGVDAGAAEVHPGGGGITAFRGGGSPTRRGLIISGYTLEGRRPEELTALLTQGMSALNDAPR